MTILGYSLGGVITLITLALLVGFSAYSTTLGWFGTPLAVPTYTPTSTFTHTPVPPTSTSTYTPVPPTLTPTITMTPTRTPIPTKTNTPTAVPVYARIQPVEGALIRSAPGFDASILYPGIIQGVLVELLGNPEEVDGYQWVQIRVVEDGREGWILQSLLLIATPEPSW
jgi:carbohydrate-binding DOMON domain-containing protein